MSRQVHALRQTKTLGGIGCFRSWPKFRGHRNLLYLHPLRLNRRAGHSPSGVFAEPNTHPTERIAYARAKTPPAPYPQSAGYVFLRLSRGTVGSRSHWGMPTPSQLGSSPLGGRLTTIALWIGSSLRISPMASAGG